MNLIQGMRALVVAVALALPVTAVSAQTTPATPAALQAAGEIVKLTGATELFAPLVPGVIEQAKLLFVQQNPMLSADVNAIGVQLRKEYEPRLTEVYTKVIEIYASHFTEGELKEILAFYSSPTGKKMVVEQPKLVNESLRYAQEWANSLSDEMVGRMRDELKKKGHKL